MPTTTDQLPDKSSMQNYGKNNKIAKMGTHLVDHYRPRSMSRSLKTNISTRGSTPENGLVEFQVLSNEKM